ncbi:MAG TPA: membrane protein insertase YidC [Bacteroidales bacterium]|nr:membrane protein insertase YidC [Bacteroidales bacterium]
MNRDSLIGFVLIAAILIGYSIWMTPSKEELERRQYRLDSIAQVKRQQQMQIDSLRMLSEQQQAQQEMPVTRIEDTATAFRQLNDRFGAFAAAATGQEQLLTVTTDVLSLQFSTKGGFFRQAELNHYKTWDGQPLRLFDTLNHKFDISFFSRNRIINTAALYFEPYLNGQPVTSSQPLNIADSAVFSMRLYAGDEVGNKIDNQYIEYIYRLRNGEYMLKFDILIHGMQDVIAQNTSFLNIDWQADLLQQERSVDQFNGSTIYFKHHNDEVDYLSETKDEEKVIKTRVKWVSFKQRFFSASLIADEAFDNALLKVHTKDKHHHPRYLRSVEASMDFPYNASGDQTLGFSMYVGPNSFNQMRAYKLDLERQIPLGWGFFLLGWINMYVVIPIFNWLGSYGMNYGIVILILTLIIKIILFPIAYKTYISSARMRVLKPEIDEISAKYPKQEDAMKKQQAIMELYKKAGVNPMAGCVPMLLQLPILIAMFRFFPSSIELRQQAFLWAHDLSSYDSVLDLPFNIPFYGSHVSLFTLLMTASTIIYTYLNNQMMGAQSNQMPGMKIMMYIMPIMFLGLFNNYASGLSYYYLLANLITFAQMYIFRISINEDKLHKQIQENKKKPVKKSAFQRRLEEAARSRGVK